MFPSAKPFDKGAGRAELTRRRAMPFGDHVKKILRFGATAFGLWCVIAVLKDNSGPHSSRTNVVLAGLSFHPLFCSGNSLHRGHSYRSR